MATGAVVAHPADKYANATQPWMRYQPRVDTLTAYKPTMAQRIPDMVKDGLRALGLNKFAANAFGSPIADVLGYSPVGAVAQSWDAGQAAARADGGVNKALGLGGGMALAALGAVPGGKALRGAERIFYRGTNGSAERIAGGIGEGLLFASPQERIAKLYGDNIEKIAAKPEAKILRESSRDFARLIGRKTGGLYSAMRPGESVHSLSNDAIAKAREAGYDAVDFDKTTDVGTAIINEAAFIRNHGKPPLAMDEASRMARAAEQGFDTSRPMYRGMSRAYDSGKTGNYQMFTSSPLDASEYAGGFEGANVLPAFTRGGKGATIDAGGANWNAIPRYAIPDDIKAQLHPSVGAQVRTDEFIHAARDAGYDSATIQNVFDNISGTIRTAPRPAKNRDSELDALFAELDGMDLGVGADVPMIADQAVNYAPVTVQAIFDPANIRSKFAAFDPAKRGSANLLAGLGLGGLGYGLMSGTNWSDPTQY